MVEHRQEQAVQDAVGAGECIDAVIREKQPPDDDDDTGYSYGEEKPSRSEFDARGEGQQRDEQEISVLFDGQCPGVRNTSDVVLDIQQISP